MAKTQSAVGALPRAIDPQRLFANIVLPLFFLFGAKLLGCKPCLIRAAGAPGRLSFLAHSQRTAHEIGQPRLGAFAVLSLTSHLAGHDTDRTFTRESG